MAEEISSNVREAEEIESMEKQLSLALNSPIVRRSLIERGDALRLANDDMLSFVTRRGVYLDFNPQTGQLALTHLDWRESASTYQNPFEYQEKVPVIDVLTPRQAAEYLSERGVNSKKLLAKLSNLLN